MKFKKILRKFSHPNIVRFIDLIETQSHLYIVTEYCRDGDLKELLSTKKMSEQEAFLALYHITEGFKELQKHSIIHRDLKPANILIDNGIFKIADFGFAKAVSNASSTHMLRSLVGSPYYMAPQLLATQQYCYKCDIWSFAVIYYEIVLGDLPWLASDPQSLLKKILQQPIIHKLKNAKISNFNMFLLERCLTVDEQRRPSWDEVFQMIQQSPMYKNVSQGSNLQLRTCSEDNIIASVDRNKIIIDSNANSQTQSQFATPSEEILLEQTEIMNELQKIRQELVFKHYVSTEMFVNRDDLQKLCNEDVNILYFVLVLTKDVTHNSLSVITDIREKEKKKPQLFLMSKDLTQLKGAMFQENEYYCSFQRDVKDLLDREKMIEKLKLDPDLKQYTDLDLYQIKDTLAKRNVETCLIKYGTAYLKGISNNFEKVAASVKFSHQQLIKKMNQDDDTTRSLMTLTEQILNYIRVLRDRRDDSLIDYEDLFDTHCGQKDMSVYISIVGTNLNAFLLH